MAEVQIGEFKRPGIFIKEFDNSTIQTPTVEGIQTLVIGFSRKGTFNAPVILNTQTDLEAIYGPTDRFLEKKGSFFHRTISKMLDSSPVVALNLLLTDDTLDTIEYRSMSTSSGFTNDVKRTGPYRRFFDTSGFWERDTESFINLTSENLGDSERVLHFTNLSDKPITYFIFKSQTDRYDVTLLEWYGATEKVPTYLDTNDYVSDYMVDVFVVAGDWTDHQQLAVDTKWGAYFNTSGLRKDQAVNFINDRNVTLLRAYDELSIIPFFRDENNSNIFIETIINRDTETTGLFCAYDIDAVESDFPNGLLDIIGNSIAVDNEIQEIDFLSYKETIVEEIDFVDTVLDLPGNSLGFGSLYKGALDRTSLNAEGYVSGVTVAYADSSAPIPSAPSTTTITYAVADGAYAIIGGQKLDLNSSGVGITQSFIIDADDYIDATGGGATTYHSVFTIDNTGVIKTYNNSINDDNVVVPATDIVLSYLYFDVENSGSGKFLTNIDVTSVTVDAAGFIELAESANPYEGNFVNGVTQSRVDFTITDVSGNLTWEFESTAGAADTSDYEQYRRIKMFNNIIANIDGPNKDKMVMLIDNNIKKSLETMTVTDIKTGANENKAFTLNTGLDSADMLDLLGGCLALYVLDNELIIGLCGLKTKEEFSDGDEGVVAKYSNFYEKFRDGIINSGDFFYENKDEFTGDIDADVTFMDVLGDDYIVFFDDGVGTALPALSFNTNDKVIIPDSVLNTGEFTIIDPTNQAVAIGLTAAGYQAYKVNENTVAETITDVNRVWQVNKKHYLKMWFDSSNDLTVIFSDQQLISTFPLNNLLSNLTLTVFSQNTNFKQTVEIESPVGYEQEPNKVLVVGSRYTEVKIGDFLEAYVDTAALEVGEVPRKLTRIIDKRTWSGDPSLVVLTTDSKIQVDNFGGDLQTTRFTTVEDYILTYKGTMCKGFKVRSASIPDGTEDRMDDILNLIEGKQVNGVNWTGTSLFNALTNKDAISFRYIVDSFGLGLQELSKQQLMQVSGKRLDCFTFINMPSMKAFKNSTSPSFTDAEGVLKTEFIRKGGDPESSPAFLYSFGEGPGVSTAGYFAPYVIVNDNGRPLSHPPAPFVATTYMRKHNSVQTNIKPWTISAGITNGQVTGIGGLEFDFTPEDIIELNLMKANPVIAKRNRGFNIETENTAQTLLTSALSFIHVREVLIELEGELADMLLNFQWKFNTPEVRAEIKLRADIICEKFVNQNGLFNFFNKIDEENNTPTIIDNQIGVLDTFVEPIKGMGIIINNIEILRTGGIASSGFA